MSEPDQDSKGFFQEVRDSVRSHIEERARSPFAGAFIVSWLAINWPALTYFLSSDRPVVERIAVVGKLLGPLNSFLYPVLLAFVLAIAFYVCSSVFLLLAEAYGVIKRFSSRKFDRLTWIAPGEYIRLKQGFDEENAKLMLLASGNLELVEAERLKAVESTRKALEFQDELAQRSIKLEETLSELGIAREELATLRGMHQEMLSQMQSNAANRQRRNALSAHAKRLSEQLRKAAHGIRQGGSTLSELNAFINDVEKLLALVDDVSPVRSAASDAELTIDSIALMLRARYPGFPVDLSVVQAIFSDMQKAGITAQVYSASDLEKVLDASGFALEMYRADNPTVFTKATDFVSKGLGFSYPEFSKVHRFSGKTREAIQKYAHLVEKDLLPG